MSVKKRLDKGIKFNDFKAFKNYQSFIIAADMTLITGEDKEALISLIEAVEEAVRWNNETKTNYPGIMTALKAVID